MLKNSLISFEEMIKKSSVFDLLPDKTSKSLLSNIFQRFDIESRSLLLKLYQKHLSKYSMKQSLSLAENKAPFKPNKSQRKAFKKLNRIYTSPNE